MKEAKYFLVVRFAIEPQVEAQVMRWLNPMASIIDGYRTVLWGTYESGGPVAPIESGVRRRAIKRPPASKPGWRGRARVTRCPSWRSALLKPATTSPTSLPRA